MKKGYLVYAVDLLGCMENGLTDEYMEDNTFCFFSYIKKEINKGYEEKHGKFLVLSCDEVYNIKDIYNSLFENGYDGEYIEYFIQKDVPYNFR